MREHAIDVLVSKNSGGAASAEQARRGAAPAAARHTGATARRSPD